MKFLLFLAERKEKCENVKPTEREFDEVVQEKCTDYIYYTIHKLWILIYIKTVWFCIKWQKILIAIVTNIQFIWLLHAVIKSTTTAIFYKPLRRKLKEQPIMECVCSCNSS